MEQNPLSTPPKKNPTRNTSLQHLKSHTSTKTNYSQLIPLFPYWNFQLTVLKEEVVTITHRYHQSGFILTAGFKGARVHFKKPLQTQLWKPHSNHFYSNPRYFLSGNVGLPVGSKSWVLLQRSTFCFLSAGDSLLKMLPCLPNQSRAS